MSNEQPKQQADESLGVEQLPQDELDASSGDEDVQASNLEVNAAGVATTSADSSDSSKQQDSNS